MISMFVSLDDGSFEIWSDPDGGGLKDGRCIGSGPFELAIAQAKAGLERDLDHLNHITTSGQATVIVLENSRDMKIISEMAMYLLEIERPDLETENKVVWQTMQVTTEEKWETDLMAFSDANKGLNVRAVKHEVVITELGNLLTERIG